MFDTPQGELNGIHGWLTAQEMIRAAMKANFQHSAPELLLKHGHQWHQRLPRLPNGVRRGLPRECYRNSSLLAIDDDRFTYVEGVAQCHMFPVEHAWCVDALGRVVDVTWPYLKFAGTKVDHVPFEYFGIAIKTSFLRKELLRCKKYGLIYQPPRHPLFNQPPEKWLASVKPLSEKEGRFSDQTQPTLCKPSK